MLSVNFTESDAHLIMQGLDLLLASKQEALRTKQEALRKVADVFSEYEFGIPQIMSEYEFGIPQIMSEYEFGIPQIMALQYKIDGAPDLDEPESGVSA